MVALIYKTCQRNSIGILFAFFLFRLLMITCKPINYLSKYKLKGGGVCFLLFSCNPICACWDAHLDVIFFFLYMLCVRSNRDPPGALLRLSSLYHQTLVQTFLFSFNHSIISLKMHATLNTTTLGNVPLWYYYCSMLINCPWIQWGKNP